jgi:predicted TPR repeat methyltransferase
MDTTEKKPMVDQVNQLCATGQLHKAVNLCRDVCLTHEATAEAWQLYGCLSADTGDIATARSALEKATGLDPELAKAQFELGKLLAMAHDYPAAIERLQNAVQLQPDNPEIWLALGIACGLSNQATRAEGYLRRSLELQPGSANCLFNLANALQLQGKLSEAEKEYKAALQIEPEMVAAWSMLAQVRVGMRKFDEAKADANHALALDPHMGAAYFTLGNIYAALNEPGLARDYLNKAAELLPDSPDVHMRLAQVLFSLKEFAEASERLHKVLQYYPNSIDAHFHMGECFRLSKLYPRAENCYRKVLALDNDHCDAHHRLGLIFGEMNRHAESAKHFGEVLRIDPNNATAKHLVAAQSGETTASAPADYVVRLFDDYSDTFEDKLVGELGYRTPSLLYELVDQLSSPAPESLDVIDLGCGTGLCAPLFHPMARTLHGVDISPRMVEKARARALYDTLEIGDVAASLKSRVAAWDLAISADVFVYVGDLREIFNSCMSSLRPGGMFAFSVEDGDDCGSYILRPTGRFAHACKYIQALCSETGFLEIEHQAVVLRKDRGKDVNGYLFLLRSTNEVA